MTRKRNALAFAVLFAGIVTVWTGIVWAQPIDNPIYRDPAQLIDDRVHDLISRLTLEEKAQLLNHVAPDLEKYNIRSDKWNQCLHGVVWEKPTTMFPVSIAAAATWDPSLIHAEATAISDEARAIYNSWHTDPAFTGTKKGLIYRAGNQYQPQPLLGAHQ